MTHTTTMAPAIPGLNAHRLNGVFGTLINAIGAWHMRRKTRLIVDNLDDHILRDVGLYDEVYGARGYQPRSQAVVTMTYS